MKNGIVDSCSNKRGDGFILCINSLGQAMTPSLLSSREDCVDQQVYE